MPQPFPHKVIQRDWKGRRNARVFWCPIAQTYLFESKSCQVCDKRVKSS